MTTQANAVNVLTRFDPPRPAVVNTKLNVRTDPSRGGVRVSRLEPGEPLQVDAVVEGEAYMGQNRWLQLASTRHFVWSGGATFLELSPTAQPPAAGPTAPDVTRRTDGTIKPLTVKEIERVFSRFDSNDTNPLGAIEIDRPWIDRNIVPLPLPGLGRPGFRSLEVHRAAEPYFTAAFDEIRRRGLVDLLLTCGGTFVPRHIGWDPDRPLSSHSWGIAIDLNVAWNGYGKLPAVPGQIGSLREIVPIFAEQGFAWGGHFQTNLDGMHFELARRNP